MIAAIAAAALCVVIACVLSALVNLVVGSIESEELQ